MPSIETKTTQQKVYKNGVLVTLIVREQNGKRIAALSKRPDGRYQKAYPCAGCGQLVCSSCVCMGC